MDSSADVPNSIIEISSPNTLYVDEIFPNSDVDTIFCLWYTNREAAHRAAGMILFHVFVIRY